MNIKINPADVSSEVNFTGFKTSKITSYSASAAII